MGRVLAPLRLRLVVELKTGFEELNETGAVTFRRVGLTDTRRAAIHANLNHRLIVGYF